MPETKVGFLVRLGELFRTYPLQMFLATAAVLAVGAAAGILVYQLLSTGDEPPIRVKGGSIRIEMVAKKNTNKWQLSNGKWKFKNGHREYDTYEVVVGTLPGAVCPNGTYAHGKTVKVTYKDNTWVDFASVNKSTEVTPSGGIVQPEDMVLAHEGGEGDYIDSVLVDGTAVCTFTAKAQLGDILLLDY